MRKKCVSVVELMWLLRYSSELWDRRSFTKLLYTRIYFSILNISTSQIHMHIATSICICNSSILIFMYLFSIFQPQIFRNIRMRNLSTEVICLVEIECFQYQTITEYVTGSVLFCELKNGFWKSYNNE